MEVYASLIHAGYPTRATLDASNLQPGLSLRGFHPLWHRRSTELQVDRVRSTKVQTPHAPRVSARGSVCSLPSSIAFTEGISLISFPPRTRMLQSRGFPFLTERSCEQEVPFGHPRITGSLRLPGAFRSLARPSSAPEPSHSPDSGASRKIVGSAHVQAAYDRVTEPCSDEASASPGSQPFHGDVSRHRGCTRASKAKIGVPRGHCPKPCEAPVAYGWDCI